MVVLGGCALICCLLDATYKTTRYALPLFFLVVKTNVDYQVVATFVSESETEDTIIEALRIIKGWNPQWMPSFFMTDYSKEEINAIKKVFGIGSLFILTFWCYFILSLLLLPPKNLWICLIFHREQKILFTLHKQYLLASHTL